MTQLKYFSRPDDYIDEVLSDFTGDVVKVDLKDGTWQKGILLSEDADWYYMRLFPDHEFHRDDVMSVTIIEELTVVVAGIKKPTR